MIRSGNWVAGLADNICKGTLCLAHSDKDLNFTGINYQIIVLMKKPTAKLVDFHTVLAFIIFLQCYQTTLIILRYTMPIVLKLKLQPFTV